MTAEQPTRDQGPGPPPEAAPTDPVVRDRRRVRATGTPAEPDQPAAGSGEDSRPQAAGPEPAGPDPGTGTAGAQPAAGGLGAELAALRAELDERTRDLQRERADFANARKRMERERARFGEDAIANVFKALLPVLDDLDRAREHGELVEGVAAIADQLTATTSKFGLTRFGERGDRFDPNHHEAVAHLTSAEVTEPTCVDVMRRGYLLGNRLLRPAMVAVADPAPPAELPAASTEAASTEASEPAEATPGGPDQPADRLDRTDPSGPANPAEG